MADWQPGDLALCVRTPVNPRGLQSPVIAGQVHTVAALHISEVSGLLGLELVGVVFSNHGINASRASNFRKVTPGANITGIEVEKRLPRKVGQDA